MKTKTTLLAMVGMTVIGCLCLSPQLVAQTAAIADGDEVMPVIDLQDTTIDAAIRGLADMANMNVHMDPKITQTPLGADNKPMPLPKVSIKWRQITARQALNALLDNYGYTAITDPKTKVTRISIKDPTAQEPLVPHVISVKYGNVTNLISLVKASLSARSQVTADTRTSQLVVQTTESEYVNLTNLINRLDVASQQVLIEARFMVTSKTLSSVKGIDWSQTMKNQNVTFGNGQSGGSTVTTTGTSTSSGGGVLPGGGPAGGGSSTPASSSGSFSTLFGNALGPVNTAGGGGGGLSVDTLRGLYPSVAFLNADGVRAVLSFLNEDSDTETISTPRAVAMEGYQTELSVVQNIPVFEQTQGAVSGGVVQQNTAKPNYELKVKDVILNEVGVKLLVTPRVVGDTNVLLDLKPEISNLGIVITSKLNGQDNQGQVFERKKINTQAMVPDGHTLVLGGLVEDTTSKGYTKIPILGDIPGLGLLFRHDLKGRDKKNLLIFVTPNIVRDSHFQAASPASMDFIKTKLKDKPDVDATAWDSGKPAGKYRPLF
ncbi:MAG: secretin N-terminal domain-containing protein [Verrucomicrobiota bacterium]